MIEMKTYHSPLYSPPPPPRSLDPFIHVPSQLPGEYTAQRPFLRLEFTLHIAITVLPPYSFTPKWSEAHEDGVSCPKTQQPGDGPMLRREQIIFIWIPAPSRNWTPHDRHQQLQRTFQQTHSICIIFLQCRPNVEDVGPTLYKCYTNVLCLLGYSLTIAPRPSHRTVVVSLVYTMIYTYLSSSYKYKKTLINYTSHFSRHKTIFQRTLIARSSWSFWSWLYTKIHKLKWIFYIDMFCCSFPMLN